MGGLAGAGYFVYLSEVQTQAAQAAQRAFERDVARLQAVVAEVRASLPGYVAAGQDPAFWAGKVSQLLQDAQARTASLERNGITTEASQHIGTTEEAVAMLQQQDGRIRSLLEQGQNVEASQLIFHDTGQLCTTASVALSEASNLQVSKTLSDTAARRWNEIYALAGAAAFAFLVLLLLVPRAIVEAQPAEAGPSTVRSPVSDAPIRLDVGHGPLDLDLKDEMRRPRAAPARQEPPSPAPVPVPARPAGASPGQLEALASLCSDLARVTDTEQLQQLLGRAASLLDATGIVIWLASEEGTLLRPAFIFGYGPQALARIQTLARTDENAVSDAFREARTEVVAGTEGRNGALVAPLVSPSGCVGAMAAETRGGGEARASTQALAAIIAAQLATLMPAEQPAGE